SGSIVRKVGLENVQPPVPIIVADRGSHACLFTAVFVESSTRGHRHVGECAIVVVVVENARGAVAGDVDVGPAIVVKVECRNAEGVVPVGLVNVRLDGDVLESAVAGIVIQN